MPFQLGTDEAGYGPNLGPLTITGTMWDVPDDKECLYGKLGQVVTNTPTDASEGRMLIADSKMVHSGSRKLGKLELPVLAALSSICQTVPADLGELFSLIEPSQKTTGPAGFWLDMDSVTLPVEADQDAICRLSDKFSRCCDSNGVRLRSVVCESIFPDEFNRGLDLHGNKASLLSNRTLTLVRNLMDDVRTGGIVGCDKHGGRSRYAGMIQALITDQWVNVRCESRDLSEYDVRVDNNEVRFCFRAKGESFLPTALASMVSKYVRELTMIAWNGFWKQHLPDIKPTQGYPQDAQRFIREIACKQKELGIETDLIWRRK